MPTEFEQQKPLDEQADFVISFVEDSREKRDDMETIWDEVDDNFLVRPFADWTATTSDPLDQNRSPRWRDSSFLKDPETHQEIMTIVAKLMLTIFPRTGFVAAKPVGFEDIHKSVVLNRLIEHTHRKPGCYGAFFEWLLSAGIRGTGILKGFWHYQEEPRTMRDVALDEFGNSVVSETILSVPTWDDPRYYCVDVRDFFPDHSHRCVRDGLGAVERFKMSAAEAYRKAEAGVFDLEAVKRAVERRVGELAEETQDKPSDRSDDLSPRQEAHPDFIQLVGYEYYGETPFLGARDEPNYHDGIARRVITVLAGETIRSKPWPRRIPFFDVRIVPRIGSFWGISPGEVIRYDQDFADTLKMMLADAVVRATHPPHIYNKNADVDVAKLRRFRPDVPVGASSVDAIQQLQYNPPVQPAFAMYQGVKQQMREATGALGAIQGLGLGTKRFSGTEAAATFEQALDRPELFAEVVEREYLPDIGQYDLALYQEFLDPDPQELAKRVGQTTMPVSLATISGDFDIEFVGSRMEGTRNQKLTAFREIMAAAANPLVAQLIPWIPLLQRHFQELGAHEIAMMVGDPQMVQVHMMLQQMAGSSPASGNGNLTAPARPPLGALPAQMFGGTQ